MQSVMTYVLLLFLLYSVTYIEQEMCVCVFWDDVRLFISDPGYATQVIQHAGPKGGLHPAVCI